MKKSLVFTLSLIAIAIVLLISVSKDFSTYATFNKAAKSGDQVKLVGTLAKDQEIYYQPEKDANYFSFYLTDKDGITKKVILNAPKPQDFELSEQIVVTGKMEDGVFMAKDVLLKCPSKYKDEEVYIKSES